MDGLTEDQCCAALGRFLILRPHLEEGVPLARIAHERNPSLRTLNRWATHYRQLGLAGLCRKSRTDRDQRMMSPTLQQFPPLRNGGKGSVPLPGRRGPIARAVVRSRATKHELRST